MAGESELGSAVIPIRAKLDALDKDLSEARSKVDKGLGGTLGTIGGGLLKLGGTVAKIGLAGAVAGAGALGGMLGICAKAASDAEGPLADLRATIASTGGAAGVTEEMALGLASSFQGLTRFEDDVVLAGENMLLTFTNIGKDVFPMATEAMLNLSQKMGQAPSQAAIQLGKALNDPIRGITALTRVGVTFTDEQKAVIEALQESGDMAGAQKIILAELEKEFGGVAVAAGNTFAGKLDILKHKFGDIQENIGGKMLPGLTKLADVLSSALDRPEVQGALGAIADGLGRVAETVGNVIGQLAEGDLEGALGEIFGPETAGKIISTLDAIQSFGAWVVDNWQPILAGLAAAILAAVVPAFASWAAAAIPAAAATVAAFAPAIAIMLAVGAVVAGLAAAWKSDFGGIRTTLTDFWERTGRPIFEQVKTWLQETLTAAIQRLSDFWTGTLQPALATVWSFIQNDALPLFERLRAWLAETLTTALQRLSDFWTGTLWPALQKVWSFIQDYILPILATLADIGILAVRVAVAALAALWREVLQPALNAVWSFVKTYVLPILKDLVEKGLDKVKAASQTLSDFWTNTLQPALQKVRDFVRDEIGPKLEWLKDKIIGPLTGALDGLKSVLAWVRDRLNELRQALDKLTLPDWLKPGSPTPFELGLAGIGRALHALSAAELPRLQHELQLSLGGLAAGGAAGGTTNNYIRNNYLTANYKQYESEMSLRDTLRALSMVG